MNSLIWEKAIDICIPCPWIELSTTLDIARNWTDSRSQDLVISKSVTNRITLMWHTHTHIANLAIVRLAVNIAFAFQFLAPWHLFGSFRNYNIENIYVHNIYVYYRTKSISRCHFFFVCRCRCCCCFHFIYLLIFFFFPCRLSIKN